MNEFRRKLLSQGVISQRSGSKSYVVPDPDGGRAKVVRDDSGNDTIHRANDSIDVTINMAEPVTAKSKVEY